MLAPLARDGCPRAQYDLARLLFSGIGGEGDTAEARRLLEAAAANKYASAQYALATFYKETHFLENAVRQGHMMAEFETALLHCNICTEDVEEGRRCLEDVLETPSHWDDLAVTLAQVGLGVLMCNTLVASPDYEKSRALFLRAAMSGHISAHSHLGCMLMEGKGGERDICGARRLLETARDKGYAPASLWLAKLLVNTGKAPERKRASMLLKETTRVGVECGDNARYSLGQMYLYGILGKKDREAARLHFAAADRNGHGPSGAALHGMDEEDEKADAAAAMLLQQEEEGKRAKKKTTKKKRRVAKARINEEEGGETMLEAKLAATTLRLEDMDGETAVHSRDEDAHLCKVCYNKPKTHAWSGCWHFSVCERCSASLRICPWCKQEDGEWVRIYEV